MATQEIELTGGAGDTVTLHDGDVYVLQVCDISGVFAEHALVRTDGGSATIDLSIVGDLNLQYVDFENIVVINGQVVTSGIDVGGNTGIIFMSPPSITSTRSMSIVLTPGMSKTLTPGVTYTVTTLDMFGWEAFPIELSSTTGGAILDLSIVGDRICSHISFQNITVINGTLTAYQSIDGGGNSGITFSNVISTGTLVSTGGDTTTIPIRYNRMTEIDVVAALATPAVIQSATIGKPTIVDLSSVGNVTITGASLRDIRFINGVVTNVNGIDGQGNGSGCIFVSYDYTSDIQSVPVFMTI